MSQSESSGLSEYLVDYRYHVEHMEWRVEAVIPVPSAEQWFIRGPNGTIRRRLPPQPSGCTRKRVEARDELDAFQQVNTWLQKSNRTLQQMGGPKL